MELLTLGSGTWEELMDREYSHIQREKNMKVIGGTIKPKVMGFIFTIIMPGMKESGTKTSNTERDQRSGRTGLYLQENIEMERKTVSENMNGEMGLVMKANGKKMKYQAMVTTLGRMVGSMSVIGRAI